MSGEPQTASEPAMDDSGLITRLRTLITERTRFDGAAVTSGTIANVTQGFALDVGYLFRIETHSEGFNGHAIPSDGECCANPVSKAATEGGANMHRRMMELRQKIEAEPDRWDIEREGVLTSGTTYYELHNCTHCSGGGFIRCDACSGGGEQKCYNCHGGGHASCYRCSGGGEETCPRCSGRGTMEDWDGRGGSMQRQCSTCYGRCRVRCSGCYGSGKTNCSSCGGRGTQRCNSCGGTGERQCGSCAGSGKLGTSARSDVLHVSTASIIWSDPQDSEAEGIGNRFGAAGLWSQSSSFLLDRNPISTVGSSIEVRYEGTVPITHLDVVCNQKHYPLTAFGVKQLWYNLGSLVTDLLTPDVEALRDQVLEVDGTGWFSKRAHDLSPLVQQIIKSEANVKLIDAAITGESDNQLDAIAGEDYRRKLQQVLGPALRRIYRLAGSESLWTIPLVALLFAAAGWWFDMAWIGVVAAVVTFPASVMHFEWKTKAVLRRALDGKERAVQAVALVKKMNGHRTIYALHAAPALAVAALVVAGGLNPRPMVVPPAPSNVVASEPIHVVTALNAAPVPGAANRNPSLARALALVHESQFGQARKLLLPLAEHGDASAYLPLAKALMRDEAGTFKSTKQIHMGDAEKWALQAVKAYPKNAEAVYVAGLAASSGLGKKSDMTIANSLFLRAAKLGNADAMNELGLSCLNGTGVPQSEAQARQWYTLAASRGNPAAMFNVGLMDWQGRGISAPDRAKALVLWRKAAAAGSTRAKQMLAKLHQPSA